MSGRSGTAAWSRAARAPPPWAGSRIGPEIAFELLSLAQGQGYATEAARAVVEWSRREGLERLHATVWSWNEPSLRVLEKLGFVETARTSPDGASGDMVVMAVEL